MNGIIIIDKPQGWTSFDVIAKLRGALHERRLGHGGTLDPMATGVLPVFVGRAAKAADMLPDSEKRYTARVKMGIRTDTGDITGSVTQRSDARCTRDELERAARGFLGEQLQVPPMYSAIKIDGRRLYDLAREGKSVERQARPIEIYSLAVTDFDEAAGEFALDVRCSKGTYVRTLAEDICAAAGCLGTLSALRRTASAGFDISRAMPLDEVLRVAESGTIQDILLPIDGAFSSLRPVTLNDNLARLFLNGFAFEAHRLPITAHEGERLRIYDAQGFVGIGECRDGTLKKLKQLREPQQGGERGVNG